MITTINLVGTDLVSADVMSNMFSSTFSDYPDLDRFDRVVKSKWTKDLATDKDFSSVVFSYDRNSNMTSTDESVHLGFDVKYTIDDIDRLVQAEEGTLSSGSITSKTRDQQWTLTQVGNADYDKTDLNGDGDFVDTGEMIDHRSHSVVNELTGRDTDNNGTDNYTLAYDAANDLTDDGKSYEYEYDAFGRLRKVKKTTDQSLVQEYKYNGLGFAIALHADTDIDGDVDSNDKWYYSAYDERWRVVATFRENDTSPKEEFILHAAGGSGKGGSSQLDSVICRYKDANTAWTSASDGTLEEVVYYCQNWRADVGVVVSSTGRPLEWVKYSAYGRPFGLPRGDANSDGDCDAADGTQVQTWANVPAYDVRGDLDLDGDVDATDHSLLLSDALGVTLGRGSLSQALVNNRIALSGHRQYLSDALSARRRLLNYELGRWSTADPQGYVDGASLYEYVKSRPQTLNDLFGEQVSVNPTSITGKCSPEVSYTSAAFPCFVNNAELHFKLQWLKGTQRFNESPGACSSPCTMAPTGFVEIWVSTDDGNSFHVTDHNNPSDVPSCNLWHGNANCTNVPNPGCGPNDPNSNCNNITWNINGITPAPRWAINDSSQGGLGDGHLYFARADCGGTKESFLGATSTPNSYASSPCYIELRWKLKCGKCSTDATKTLHP